MEGFSRRFFLTLYRHQACTIDSDARLAWNLEILMENREKGGRREELLGWRAMECVGGGVGVR